MTYSLQRLTLHTLFPGVSAVDIKAVTQDVVDILQELLLDQAEYAHAARHINGTCVQLSLLVPRAHQ